MRTIGVNLNQSHTFSVQLKKQTHYASKNQRFCYEASKFPWKTFSEVFKMKLKRFFSFLIGFWYKTWVLHGRACYMREKPLPSLKVIRKPKVHSKFHYIISDAWSSLSKAWGIDNAFVIFISPFLRYCSHIYINFHDKFNHWNLPRTDKKLQ